MEKDLVIKLRKQLKNNHGSKVPLRIFTDENYIFDEATMLLCWDDANQLLYGFTANNHRESNVGQPAMIIVASYDNIVRMEAIYNSETFKEQLDAVVSKNLTNQDSADAVYKQVFDLSKMDMYIAPEKGKNPYSNKADEEPKESKN